MSLASRILGAAHQGDFIWGHASSRDPGGRGVWIKPSGFGLDEITPDIVHLVDADGRVVEGSGKVHLELAIHTEIMEARPDVGGVVHTHSPYAVALAASGQNLLPVSHAASFFSETPIPRFDETSDLIMTRVLGRSLARALGQARAIFLVNHGIVTVGPSLESATFAALLLEQAAFHQHLVRGFGSAPTVTSAEELPRKRDHIYNDGAVAAAWDYLVRGLRAQAATQAIGQPIAGVAGA